MKPDSRKSSKAWLAGGSAAWTALGLGVVLLFDLIFIDGFFRVRILDGRLYGTPIDILHQGSKVMLLAIGMTLVIATGGVDLSVGSLMAIAGSVAAVAMVQAGWPPALALPAALAATTLLGMGNGFLVAAFRVQPIVATLILMVAGRGIAMLVTSGQIITFEDPFFVFIGNGHLLGLPFTLVVVAAMFILTQLLMRRTAFGLFIASVGDNETASRLCGLPSATIKVLVYAFSGFCAGCAGLIAASNIKAADSSRVGEMMELDAIFAVVVGGTALTGGRFQLGGSILGAILIQTLTVTMYNLGVPPSVAPVPKAIVIVAVCLLQSEAFQQSMRNLIRRRSRA